MAEAQNNSPMGDSRAEPGMIPGATDIAQEGVKNYFQRKLAEERGESPAAASTDVDSTDPGEQPDGNLDPEQSAGGADAAAAEQPTGDDLDLDSSDEEEQSEEGDTVGLDIDGEFVTAQQIREWKEGATEGGMRLEDYRRKTQIVSRVRQEHEALGETLNHQTEALNAKAGVLMEAIEGELRRFEGVDPTTLTQEQFAEFQRQYASTKAGADRIRAAFAEVDTKLIATRGAAYEQKAGSTREMLKWHEPRWNNEFYGGLRSFAVTEGLMSEDQFNNETDFLRLVGLMSLMDRANVDDLVTSKKNEMRPSKGTPRQRQAPRSRNAQGQYQSAEQNLRANPGDRNARQDYFRAKLAAERR